MAIPATDVVAPLAGVLDRIIPDPQARDAAKLELLRLDRHELTNLYAAMTGARTPTPAADRWSTRARPTTPGGSARPDGRPVRAARRRPHRDSPWPDHSTTKTRCMLPCPAPQK